ncbi:MAG: DNA polymerase I [Clostridiales bacterium]|nr:DNA polymerase I [Clostridiales bacterium]
MSKKLMLIDGNSIINRAFHAYPQLTNKDGVHTGAVYGFLKIALKFFDEEKPEYIAVAFDVSAPTFRHGVFAEYKGTRKPMAEELRPQIPLLRSLLEKMGIAAASLEGYEADDIIGTLSARGAADGMTVSIVSGDRDMLQLCSDAVKTIIPTTKAGKPAVEIHTAQSMMEAMGVSPKQYIDVKALMGDASDNIPGVPGIGEKTALKIIQQYGSLENAVKMVSEITPPRAAKNIEQYREQAFLSRDLAEIRLDAPIELELAGMAVGDIFTPEAFDEIKRLEFRSLFARFESGTLNKTPSVGTEGVVINTLNELEEYISQRNGGAFQIVFIDGENKGASFAFESEMPAFAPISEEIDEAGLFRAIAPYLESDGEKVTFDFKRGKTRALKFGVNPRGVVFDPAIAAYILDASRGSYPYEYIVERYLGETPPAADSALSGKGAKKQIDAAVLERVAWSMPEAALRLKPITAGALAESGQTELFEEIETPLCSVLAEMENAGVRVDAGALQRYGEKLDEKINELTARIYDLAGERFNINSPAQLGVILFEKLNIKSVKKTKTGYSTAADALEKIAGRHPIVSEITEYRTYSKLKNTYVTGLLSQIGEDGKIRTTFQQTAVSTGRLSSVDPNLQNIPARIPLGRELRKVFVPSDGYLFADSDYSQIELRVLAHMSGDETLIQAFNEDQDIHRLTASRVFHTPYEEVTDFQRGAAKAVNFGIVYGIGAFSLSEDLRVTRKEAELYIESYFAKYPKVKLYMDKTIEDAYKNGYVSTIFGRRRSIPELTSSNFNTRAFGERVAMNMPIQGTAADIMKIAMIRVHDRLAEQAPMSRIVLQVHDELLLEAKKEELDAVLRILNEEMENCVKLDVKLRADCNVGENWFETK